MEQHSFVLKGDREWDKSKHIQTLQPKWAFIIGIDYVSGFWFWTSFTPTAMWIGQDFFIKREH